jgi:hypothetical protein
MGGQIVRDAKSGSFVSVNEGRKSRASVMETVTPNGRRKK